MDIVLSFFFLEKACSCDGYLNKRAIEKHFRSKSGFLFKTLTNTNVIFKRNGATFLMTIGIRNWVVGSNDKLIV